MSETIEGDFLPSDKPTKKSSEKAIKVVQPQIHDQGELSPTRIMQNMGCNVMEFMGNVIMNNHEELDIEKDELKIFDRINMAKAAAPYLYSTIKPIEPKAPEEKKKPLGIFVPKRGIPEGFEDEEEEYELPEGERPTFGVGVIEEQGEKQDVE